MQKRSFDEIKNTAMRIGTILEAIKKSGHYDSRIHHKGHRLITIANSLNLIAETPNASINSEALATWSGEIDKAIAGFEEWIKDQLKTTTEECDDDEIKF